MPLCHNRTPTNRGGNNTSIANPTRGYKTRGDGLTSGKETVMSFKNNVSKKCIVNFNDSKKVGTITTENNNEFYVRVPMNGGYECRKYNKNDVEIIVGGWNL